MRRAPLAAALAVGAVAAAAATRRPAPTEAAADEARVREADLRFYRARAERDPRGALDLARAASLLAERGKSRGSAADFEEAEALARRALANQPGQPAALRALAGILMARHRFPEALAAADALVAADSGSAGNRALAAELRMELGRYDEAAAGFRALRPDASLPTVAVRLARWADLTGEPGRAHAMLVAARQEAETAWGVPASQRAWFALQVATLAHRYGRDAEARRALEEGLALAPTDSRLLETLARVARAQGRWSEVEALARRALGTGSEDPGLLLLLADAAEARGRAGDARELVDRAEGAALAIPGPIHRDVALALLDRGRSAGEILARSAADLEERRDIYGWDLQAWASRALGRSAEARRAMHHALRTGSRDPALLRHAAAIGVGGP